MPISSLPQSNQDCPLWRTDRDRVDATLQLHEAGVKMVAVPPLPVVRVKCGLCQSVECSDFLTAWFDKTKADFQHG